MKNRAGRRARMPSRSVRAATARAQVTSGSGQPTGRTGSARPRVGLFGGQGGHLGQASERGLLPDPGGAPAARPSAVVAGRT